MALQRRRSKAPMARHILTAGPLLAGMLATMAAVAQAPATIPQKPIGERIQMRLDYRGVPGCAEGELLRNALRAHIYQWEMWNPSSLWRVRAQVTPHGAGYKGNAKLFDPSGVVRWETEVTGEDSDPLRCIDVLRFFALGLAVTLLPRHPPPPPKPAEVDAPAPKPPPPPAAPQTEKPAPEPFVFRVGVDARMELGVGLKPTVGLALDVGFLKGWFSFAAEFHWIPSVTTTPFANGDTIDSRFLGVSLFDCINFGTRVTFAACLPIFELGQRQRSTVGLEGLGAQSLPYWGLGARTLGEVPLTPVVSLRAFADVFMRDEGGLTVHGPLLPTDTGGPSLRLVGALGAGLVASF
jgi:hypothetical protein